MTSPAPDANPGADPEGGLGPALVDEAGRRTGLLWVDTGDGRDRPVWHAWEDGVALLVVGLDPASGEQPLPGLAEAAAAGRRVKVTARSKDKGGRIAAWPAAVELLAASTPAWDAAAEALHGARLNEQDVDGQRTRWAEHCLLVRLVPAGDPLELPGAMPAGSHAAPPPPTPATTRGPLPFVLGRRRRRR
ncbi:MAG: hypothetical protein ACTHOD_10925 [Motilibacteraceae bacterium]